MPHVPGVARTRTSHRNRVRTTHDHTGYDWATEGVTQEFFEQKNIDGVVEPGGVPPGTLNGAVLVPGTLSAAPFASTIRPVILVTTNPTLPDPLYPIGQFIYNTADVPPRLYKNVADVWVAAVGPNDIQADSITAGQIAAGAISTSELAAGAVQAGKLQVGLLPSRNLLLNGGFRQGLTNWTFVNGGAPGAATGMWSSTATDWTLRDGDVDAWSAAAGPWGSTAYMMGTNTASTFTPYTYQDVPVVAGEYYSASALLGVHRLTFAYIQITWYDSTGATVGSPVLSSTLSSPSALAGGAWRDGWNYVTIDSALAPATAVYARFIILARTPNTSGSDWYLFMDQVWMGVGRSSRPYVPGEGYDVWGSEGNVVIDTSGITIYNGKLTFKDQFGSTAMDGGGFGPSWLRFLQSGLYNSNFAATVPTPASELNDSTNPLPNWSYSRVSGSGCTAKMQSDASAPSGRVVRFTMAAGAANDEARIEQIIPVLPVRNRDVSYRFWSNVIIGSTWNVTDLEIKSEQQYLDASGSTIGSAFVNAAANASAGGTVLPWDPISSDSENDTVPLNAAYLRVRIGLKRRTGGSTAAVGFLDVADCYVTIGQPRVIVVDYSPGSYGPGKIDQVSGVVRIFPDARGIGSRKGIQLGDSDTILVRGGFAFPSSPQSSDSYYRRDLNLQFFYDGTRWLSETLFSTVLIPVTSLGPLSGTTALAMMAPIDYHGGSDIWLETITQPFHVNAGTALSGSHKWDATYYKSASGTNTSIATLSVNSGSSSQWRDGSQTFNATIGSGWLAFRVDWTKTGTPGSIYTPCTFNYRVIAT